jgi:hypothetical protein
MGPEQVNISNRNFFPPNFRVKLHEMQNETRGVFSLTESDGGV